MMKNKKGEKIKGMTFPKFKEMFKKRLEELGIYYGLINYLLRSKDMDTLRTRCWSKKTTEKDYYFSCIVLNEMLQEMGMFDMGSLTGGLTSYEEYEERVKSIPNNS